jgi:hypothetical protein
LPAPDHTNVDKFFASLLGQTEVADDKLAMIRAASGLHMRSIVISCSMVAEDVEPTVSAVVQRMIERLKLSINDYGAIRDYVKACIRGPVSLEDYPKAADYVSPLGAVPPAIVCHAFGNGGPDGTHHAPAIFAVSMFTVPTKQLEKCGYHYDRFRAKYELPVVPHGNDVYNAGERPTQWYKGLRFDENVASETATDSIFVSTKMGGSYTTKLTDFTPPMNKYCFPRNTSHPLIDRACMAYNKDEPDDKKKWCLVIYQDKINNDGFAVAVESLNTAAASLKRKLNIPVLCVAHVIGAGGGTKAQTNFEHPYVLVRDHELAQYYTPSFASAVQLVRDRHVLTTQEQ